MNIGGEKIQRKIWSDLSPMQVKNSHQTFSSRLLGESGKRVNKAALLASVQCGQSTHVT